MCSLQRQKKNRFLIKWENDLTSFHQTDWLLLTASIKSEFSSEANHTIKIFVLRLGGHFLNLCKMLFIYLHSSRIQVSLLQVLAFILALIISKESFVQSKSWLPGKNGLKKLKKVLWRCRTVAQGSLWEPEREAGAQKPSTGCAVEKGSPELHWSSTTYPERRRGRRLGRLRRGFHFFCRRWCRRCRRDVFYHLTA